MDGNEAQPNRRTALTAAVAGGLLAATAAHPARAETEYASVMPQIPIAPPRTEFVYEAIFDLLPSMNLGMGPLGERHMVPITGGTFAGPRMWGTVLPGAPTANSGATTARTCSTPSTNSRPTTAR